VAEPGAPNATVTLSQPLFVIGAPRSGTTFLVQLLNRHPAIHITNETRIFVLLKEMIEIRSRHQWLLETPYQERFATFVRRHAGAWVEQFYREELGISRPIWGDKHPHYADPMVLEDEAKRVPGAPSGSCLTLIRDCLPRAKFIHLHRDPCRVVFSLAQKKWVGSIDEGALVWRRHVEECLGFSDALGEGQCLSIAYADLLQRPTQALSAIVNLLALPDVGEMANFLAEQRRNPTPMSAPVTDLGAPDTFSLQADVEARILELAGPAAARLGYASRKGQAR
jgi:Sulfotransferase family